MTDDTAREIDSLNMICDDCGHQMTTAIGQGIFRCDYCQGATGMMTDINDTARESEPLTEQQIANWRKALIGILGPYALIMPVEQIEMYRDKLQSQALKGGKG